jgi:hypothetical protein
LCGWIERVHMARKGLFMSALNKRSEIPLHSLLDALCTKDRVEILKPCLSQEAVQFLERRT